MGIGWAAIEETDERFRPALSVEAIFSDLYLVQLETYGRRQEPVRQSHNLLTLARQFPLFGRLLGSIGVALSYELTRISREEDDPRPEREVNKNLGLALGLAWQSKSKLFVRVEWDSAVFPAGTAGILLATSRKQSLGMGVGWQFK